MDKDVRRRDRREFEQDLSGQLTPKNFQMVDTGGGSYIALTIFNGAVRVANFLSAVTSLTCKVNASAR